MRHLIFVLIIPMAVALVVGNAVAAGSCGSGGSNFLGPKVPGGSISS
jgi:hypothetical protein